MIGLYLHIPFCIRKCAYCDFASAVLDDALFRPVVDAMKREMDGARGLPVRSVYIGGGTPTVLPTAMLAELLETARRCFGISADAEITVEANPGTVDAAKLSALRRAGVNRLSFGAQAKQRSLLEALGRIHSWEDVELAVRLSREAGFDNINLDVMYGLPGQTPADFRETLGAALALLPEHLSAYSLIIEEGTPFFERYHVHPEALPSEDAEAEMADDAKRMAEDAGLFRYEISGYALPGRECRHNLGYWLREDYLGIGCAAHSLIAERRFANVREISGYLAGEHGEERAITRGEALFERLMVGLRLTRGIPWGGPALFEAYGERLEALRARGLMDWDDERLWLTPRGLDLQNRVLVELME